MNSPDQQPDVSAFKSEGDLNLSPHRKQWLADNISAETRAWLEEDAKYFLHQSLSTPCLNVFRSCDGIYVEDLEGRRYMDFHGNNVHQVGFRNRRVIEAIKAQLDELPFCTRRYTNLPAIKLARKLTQLAPGNLKKVLFAPGGTTAIGMALKLARVATGRFKTISMWDSFHGASLDAISIGGEAIFRQNIGPLLPGTEHVPPPDPSHCPFHCGTQCSLQCAHYIEYVLEKEGDVAAVIAETVRSIPFIPPPDYWKIIRAACDRHGALLILDEIYTGFGRTGNWFACEFSATVPDVICLGKALTGGFPLSACVGRAELMNTAWPPSSGEAIHTSTFLGHPVGCAMALAQIKEIRTRRLVQRSAELGKLLLESLSTLDIGPSTMSVSARGLGLLAGVELRRPDGTPATEIALDALKTMLRRGFILLPEGGHSNIISFTPPLTISEAQLQAAVAALAQVLATGRLT